MGILCRAFSPLGLGWACTQAYGLGWDVAALLALSVERLFRNLQLLGWYVAALLALSKS
jgi:hypothetical protein